MRNCRWHPSLRPLDPRADCEEFKDLNELGVDIVTIMEILRHPQTSQTRHYVKGRSGLATCTGTRV